MTRNTEGSEIPDNSAQLSVSQLAGDAITDLLTGVTVPAPIRRNALKAFGRLCSAAVEIPVAYLEGIAAEKRAESFGRVKLIETNAEQIARQMDVDPAYARVAVRKFGQRIIREQVNLDQVSEEAARRIGVSDTKPQKENHSEIDDDWLNQFENEAAKRSAEDMQRLFARILAGEIIRPSSFSIRAVRIMGQIDKETAELFKKLCSACISLKAPGTTNVIDARVLSFGGNAASNSLQKFGLSFSQLNILQEHGLIISDYNSWMNYHVCVVRGGNVGFPLCYQNTFWALNPIDPTEQLTELKMHGVALTQAGKELLEIIDIQPLENYHSALIEYLKTFKLTLVKVAVK